MRENCNTFSPGNWQQLLSQNFNLHNTKQAEVLSQQEHLFSKDETSTNLEQAKTLIIKKKV